MGGLQILMVKVMAAETNGNGSKKFNQSDRVRRADGTGSYGVVVAVRNDAAGTPGDKGDKGIIVGVQWDSGSYSLFTPEALEVVK